MLLCLNVLGVIKASLKNSRLSFWHFVIIIHRPCMLTASPFLTNSCLTTNAENKQNNVTIIYSQVSLTLAWHFKFFMTDASKWAVFRGN